MQMRCGTCKGLQKSLERGKLRTSIACENWDPNWEILPEHLYKIYVFLSRISSHSLIVLEQLLGDEYVDDVKVRPRECGNCEFFKSCPCEPTEKDTPTRFSCDNWSFDLLEHRKDCEPVLRKLLDILEKETTKSDKPYVSYFMAKQKEINKVRSIPVAIEDVVEFKLSDKSWIKGKVVKLTSEHVVVANGRAKLSLLYSTLESPNVKIPYKRDFTKGEIIFDEKLDVTV